MITKDTYIQTYIRPQRALTQTHIPHIHAAAFRHSCKINLSNVLGGQNSCIINFIYMTIIPLKLLKYYHQLKNVLCKLCYVSKWKHISLLFNFKETLHWVLNNYSLSISVKILILASAVCPDGQGVSVQDNRCREERQAPPPSFIVESYTAPLSLRHCWQWGKNTLICTFSLFLFLFQLMLYMLFLFFFFAVLLFIAAKSLTTLVFLGTCYLPCPQSSLLIRKSMSNKDHKSCTYLKKCCNKLFFFLSG